MKYSMCLSVTCSQASSTAVNEDKRDDVGFAGADASAPGIPFIPVCLRVDSRMSEGSSLLLQVQRQVIWFYFDYFFCSVFLKFESLIKSNTAALQLRMAPVWPPLATWQTSRT